MNELIAPEIQEYSEGFTSGESVILSELRMKTLDERDDKNMLSGLYQGRLLSMFSKMTAPRTILEIGTYMGYSALCLAEGLQDGGKVITLDINRDTNAIAKSFWKKAGKDHLIEDHLAEATDIIPEMNEEFDLVFIDADKENYSNYYDLVFSKMPVGGIIIADNVLWSGDVLNAAKGDDVTSSTKALHEYNMKVTIDSRVSNILFAVRDGLMISRKESE